MARWGTAGSSLYFRKPVSSVISLWDANGVVTQAIGQQLAWIRPRADAADDNLAFTVRDTAGTPHVWLYGHGGRSGGQLPHLRSSPVWVNGTAIFYFPEAPFRPTCGPGPSTPPHRQTFTLHLRPHAHSAPPLSHVPRPL